jgi:hypothetical protein
VNTVAATAELSLIYHSVHHHSYLSTDCGIKLSSAIFKDSKLVRLHCGHTKCEMLMQNALAPHSVEILLNDLKDETFFFHFNLMLLIKETLDVILQSLNISLKNLA